MITSLLTRSLLNLPIGYVRDEGKRQRKKKKSEIETILSREVSIMPTENKLYITVR